MTNTTAAIIVTIATNWTSIGTFTPISGPACDVQMGRIVTNVHAIIEWKEQRKELLVESRDGPEIGERRVPRPPEQVIVLTNWANRGFYIYTNNVMLTNYYTLEAR